MCGAESMQALKTEIDLQNVLLMGGKFKIFSDLNDDKVPIAGRAKKGYL